MTQTARPASASSAAHASPTTPAPTTTASVVTSGAIVGGRGIAGGSCSQCEHGTHAHLQGEIDERVQKRCRTSRVLAEENVGTPVKGDERCRLGVDAASAADVDHRRSRIVHDPPSVLVEPAAQVGVLPVQEES